MAPCRRRCPTDRESPPPRRPPLGKPPACSIGSADAAARAPRAPPRMIGTLLGGRYRILEEIGRGGMGVVYRADDTRLPRDVAVKVISPDKLHDETLRRRFRKEALHLAPLNHPNVVTVLDAGSDGDREYLVM